ncbi:MULTISPECIES: DDE-type integrase/transposase/recombinase [unclassified Paenibacillus]|uniref:DDE-type integrase/transposase/recombinase n=1 Tax=unclassified Paenibacillus TaxID=185978 RepID=UPI002780A59E|nr:MULTISPECIES: DDE-type integrase/transposase/recombinase [unclassified Paenibacillus]MDQ0899208.1 transposase InsO family protein [Paenibacillus sp. V4I7]MDQ0914802.1 transposase InsO family protein [Paenibacillus sp. V4I5]
MLNRDFTAGKPNDKWVTDVTPYRVGDQRLYLSAIKDLYGNDIVAFHISHRNDNELVLKTFDKAFKQHKDVTGVIVHSDQGLQLAKQADTDRISAPACSIGLFFIVYNLGSLTILYRGLS